MPGGGEPGKSFPSALRIIATLPLLLGYLLDWRPVPNVTETERSVTETAPPPDLEMVNVCLSFSPGIRNLATSGAWRVTFTV
jgi:hypothetical protein